MFMVGLDTHVDGSCKGDFKLIWEQSPDPESPRSRRSRQSGLRACGHTWELCRIYIQKAPLSCLGESTCQGSRPSRRPHYTSYVRGQARTSDTEATNILTKPMSLLVWIAERRCSIDRCTSQGNIFLAMTLIDAGCDVNVKDTSNDDIPLHKAAAAIQLTIIRALPAKDAIVRGYKNTAGGRD